ncbi:DNA polymerase III subunit epsilon [Acinetobacter sp.]|uniref:DNA polymerase III subunit epsilon n=1 Tax=Acinetobacter sp. TaxID=472 RepID=UPI0038909713
MTQTITLYVDGACRGNPGLGGWGAYLIYADQSEQKYWGGEFNTTNNRMELTAAIEGIRACPADAKLIIWTDSTYVQKGITEWIVNWKKKNWKNVKNPDLWQALDQITQGRDIDWRWVKGHAGNAGNEMADQLANLGADQTARGKSTPQANNEPDWLLDDPFGFDLIDEDLDETETETETETESKLTQSIHPQIVMTEAKLQLHGPRQFILDTETTGFYFQDGDRIIEVGAIEMINRKLTGRSIHIYINPEKPVGESENIHGISDEFLQDKPKYAEIADVLYDYLKGAEIIAHNATFDMNFLDMEFERVGLGKLSAVCSVTDTLAMAKAKHPGQKNSLDALVRRYEIKERDRTFHGALLDAEILADVYLAMTGGQVAFDIEALSHSEEYNAGGGRVVEGDGLLVVLPSAQELEQHENWVKQYFEKHGENCLFAK